MSWLKTTVTQCNTICSPTADVPKAEIKKQHYEEAKFAIPTEAPPGVWRKETGEKMPTNCQITVHSGPTEKIAAMATIDIADLKELVSKMLISYISLKLFVLMT